MKALNLNEIIKVKLTVKGADIYYHQYDELNKIIEKNGGIPLKPRMPKIDSEGYTEFQLWNFMELYGEYFKMGMTDYPIQGLNIYIEEETLDDVKGKE